MAQISRERLIFSGAATYSYEEPQSIPVDLPIPQDDGACNHLLGAQIPSLPLKSMSDTLVDLSCLKGLVVLYFYPMIGKPDVPPMAGRNEIPGARLDKLY